jgi:hypothetical protein
MNVVGKGRWSLISDIRATPFALCRDKKSKTTPGAPRLEVPRRGEPATVWYDPSTGEAIANLGG